MNKINKISDKYTLNRMTTLTVNNKPVIDKETGKKYYATEVVLKHKTGSNEPLVFSDSDSISDFINNIDLDDEQQSLGL